MKHERPRDQDRPPASDPAGIPRRRLLLSTGGIALLAVGVGASADKTGWPAAMVRAGRAWERSAPRRTPSPPTFRETPDDPVSVPPGPEDSATASTSATADTPSSTPTPSVAPQPRTAPQYYIDDAGPMAIALTLDDGPDPLYTPQVLDILAGYGITATFNMIGEQIGSNLSLVREVAAAGHTITNHTWNHADMRAYSLDRVLSEIDQCNDALADAGQEPTIFRAPYGYWTQAVFDACAARDLTPLGWSVDPRDWDTDNVTTDDIVRTVLRTTKRHDIILEHDGGGDRSNTVAALQIFIPELLDRGFVFAPV